MAFGGGLDDNQDAMSEINMTPLVDVMLVLLIIFMLTVPVLNQAVKVDLPQADSTPNHSQPDTVSITVAADASLHWNDVGVSFEDLQARLRAAAAQTPQPEVQLRGDRHVAYDHVIRVMAAAQQAGLSRLGFVTEPVQ